MPEKMTDRERQRRAEQSQNAREENAQPEGVQPEPDDEPRPDQSELEQGAGENTGQIAQQGQQQSGKQGAK